MKEQTLALSAIKPYHNNPRDIEPAVPGVMESIRRFGYVVPIVVDSKYVIITGHTRYEALKRLGWTEAMVIVSDMKKSLAQEFRLVDNRSSEIADWDRDRLVAELRSIEEGMDPFFQGDELSTLMKDLLVIDDKLVSHDVVASTQDELQNHFAKLAKGMEDRVQFVNCQHCGKRFGFDTDIKGFGKEYVKP